MELKTREKLLPWLRNGLPLDPHPYRTIAAQIGSREEDVIAEIAAMIDAGVVSRFGVIVDHRAIGFTANAMVVWDVPDDIVDEAGARLAASPGVSLCYRRERHLKRWPYNLFTMIHGRCRDEVCGRVEMLADICGLSGVPRHLLYTVRRFKQTAPLYGGPDN